MQFLEVYTLEKRMSFELVVVRASLTCSKSGEWVQLHQSIYEIDSLHRERFGED
jgi:hypothetical protein